jgi:glutathione peroxidase
MSPIYSFSAKDIHGKDVSLESFKGKALLIVNVASQCGNTPQYKGLEESYKKYHAQGFEVLGFPANNFGAQEPGTEAEIESFCSLNYGVSFPLFSKISAVGPDIHPLYRYLTTQSPFPGDVTWNFAKFLVNRQGEVVARFSPKTPPESPEVQEAIQKAL